MQFCDHVKVRSRFVCKLCFKGHVTLQLESAVSPAALGTLFMIRCFQCIRQTESAGEIHFGFARKFKISRSRHDRKCQFQMIMLTEVLLELHLQFQIVALKHNFGEQYRQFKV